MPLFFDHHRHLPEGAGAAEVAGAHAKDVEIQDKYGVDYQRYWIDETNGQAWCLVEAPDAETAAAVHKEAHGLLADEIFAVVAGK